MPEEKLLFVINPVSGDIEKDDLKTQVRNFMKERDKQVEFFHTTGENDKQKITDKLEELQPETIVAVGGDGTCNLVAQTIVNKPIQMGILPLGSANGMASELNLPTTVDENLRLITTGKSKKTDVLKINEDHICLHLSDIGFNAQLINTFEESDSRGMFGYTKSFIEEFGNAQPASFEITLNDSTFSQKAFMVVLANASKFGTGAVINPEGKVDDGLFELVIIRPESFTEFLKMLVPFYTRRIHTLDFIDTYKCKKVQIKNPERQTLQIDGEIIGQPLQVNVEILPRRVEMIIP
ncbi:diacylglycerol/lipid kinase family protein [Draconibacterium halophilum]|uniref:YegS/Rv2252/BmrU family lipid kinase n=1 Tax=Draconibacterium halophilum TaxID=2706887 RepID=A0A6C0RIE2_9BACT|nr:YegS/Rv2252/BmrU family lipid kinase [Draconibacterium halophilum]QIA09313.1 YegS/Rv2252/BmrU family lipid kinase [Draconibacterium halophilum]